MKELIFKAAIAIVTLMTIAGAASAQTDKPYTEGPLWQVQFIQAKAGMGELYLKNLSEGWIKEMRAAKDAGLIMDFKVLNAPMGSENDWNLMLMYEIKNYAMLDGMTDKIDALAKKLFGSEETMHANAVSRNELRALQGGKLTQELIFK